jgi:hypothetical protein
MARLDELAERRARLMQRCDTERAAVTAEAAALAAAAVRIDYGVNRLRRLPLVVVLAVAVAAGGVGGLVLRRRSHRMHRGGLGLALLSAAWQLAARLRRAVTMRPPRLIAHRGRRQ